MIKMLPSESINGCVLDASAMLAWLNSEPGSELVDLVLTQSSISSVNWAEVLQTSRGRGIVIDTMQADLEALGVEILAFTAEDAELVAQLYLSAKHLSLGDRACLALAQRLNLPALTADKIWLALALEIEIILIC